MVKLKKISKGAMDALFEIQPGGVGCGKKMYEPVILAADAYI
ncbi:hypothetical protein [Mesobacillus subterraneus]|nr:hypothetical protein [Mesobacillus subterraneus]